MQNAEELVGKFVRIEKPKLSDKHTDELILGLIQKMISFNLEKDILSPDETDFLHDIINGKNENDFDAKAEIEKYFKQLEKKGFKFR